MVKMFRKLTVALLAIGLLVGCSKTDEIAQESQKQTEQVQDKIMEEKESEKSEYLDVLGNSLQVFSDNMNLIHNQYEQAQKELYLLTDAHWRTETKEYFDTIAVEGDILDRAEANGEVPEEYQEIHNKVQEAFALNEQAGNTLLGDLSTATDKSTLELGANTMQESVEMIEEVNKLLSEKQK